MAQLFNLPHFRSARVRKSPILPSIRSEAVRGRKGDGKEHLLIYWSAF